MKRTFANWKVTGSVAAILAGLSMAASAYDGQHCSEPGVCWEAKPGFSATIAGSKYDPKHDPAEIAKQGTSERAMEARNKLRADNFKKTGHFIYDVDKIPH
jgi:methanol dehydrogenase (cytochrome c) subunit 2